MKGVGYCYNGNCPNFLSGLFVMNYSGNPNYCPKCRREVEVVVEVRDRVKEDVIYSSVEVSFDYNAVERRYMYRAIVAIEPKINGEMYHYSSPLVRTEKRALKIGESLINIINTGYFVNDGTAEETVLSLDKPHDEFEADLSKLDKILQDRERRLMHEG